ncbi:hypothetical protein [Streptomyces sp. NPDC005046]
MGKALWTLFTVPEPDCPRGFPEYELPVMVATMASASTSAAMKKSRSLTGTGSFITDLRQLDRESICGAKEN